MITKTVQLLESQMSPGNRADQERADPGSDTQEPAWKIARCLYERARAASQPFQKDFSRDWLYLLGENHWNPPKNAVAMRSQAYKNRSVRNWLYATCDQKAAMLLQPKRTITPMPYAGTDDILEIWHAKEILENEIERIRGNEYEEDAVWDGMATGAGFTRVLVRTDQRSGMKFVELEDMDPRRVFPDPAASRPHQARYISIALQMDMAEIRQTFPDTWHKVKPEQRNAVGDPKNAPKGSGASTSFEVVAGGGSEYLTGKGGSATYQTAEVVLTWIRDEEVSEDIEEREIHGEIQAYECAQCGEVFEGEPMMPLDPLSFLEGPLQGEDPGMDALPPAVSCPTCGSEALLPVTIPAKSEETGRVRRFRYPFGRLIATTKTALLDDRANPDEIDAIFPIFMYPHYRVTNRLWGYGEVSHLKSAQMSADKTITQLMDYVRSALSGALEYPDEAVAFENLGNTPNLKIGLPPSLMGLARYLPAPVINLQAIQLMDEINRRDFMQMSGISDVSTGVAPNAPTSGVEVQARQTAANLRMEGHFRRFNQYRTDLYNAVWQLMWQNYTEQRVWPVKDSYGRVKMLSLEIQKLSRSLNMTVTCDTRDTPQSEITGQVLQGLMAQGSLPMMPEILLPYFGVRPSDSKLIQNMMALRMAEQKAEEEAAIDEEAQTMMDESLGNGQMEQEEMEAMV